MWQLKYLDMQFLCSYGQSNGDKENQQVIWYKNTFSDLIISSFLWIYFEIARKMR